MRYEMHWLKQLKNQPVLLISSSVHNSSINEYKNMKLREKICFERINLNLYYWGFRNKIVYSVKPCTVFIFL